MELELIRNKIYEIRSHRIMLDFDLAEMYQVETRVLNQSVKRNLKRFPPDFMFQLTKYEWENLTSQIVISSWGGIRKLPYAFTEQGIAMLSGLLNSNIAIAVNISIMRAFVAARNYVLQQSAVSKEIEDLWKAINDLSEDNRKELDDIYLVLSELAAKQKSKQKPRQQIGYTADRYTTKNP